MKRIKSKREAKGRGTESEKRNWVVNGVLDYVVRKERRVLPRKTIT